jgi:hypothetical protein
MGRTAGPEAGGGGGPGAGAAGANMIPRDILPAVAPHKLPGGGLLGPVMLHTPRLPCIENTPGCRYLSAHLALPDSRSFHSRKVAAERVSGVGALNVPPLTTFKSVQDDRAFVVHYEVAANQIRARNPRETKARNLPRL